MPTFSGIDAAGFSTVFLLLVFAMLIAEVANPTPFHHGVGIDLPKVRHPVAMWRSDQDDAILISVMRDGKTFFGREQVTPSQLSTLIGERLAKGAERKAYIKADARVRYRSIKEVVDAAHSAGIGYIGLLADQQVQLH